jgi:phage/plasmid-like protein (TIGR03299 family)
MSHELTTTNGKVEMAFIGETPWHGLGQRLEENQPIEVWLEAAGMSWTAQKSFVRYATGRDQDATQWRQSDSNCVIFRNDNLDEMGIVSRKFQIVQPRATLEFFRDLVGEAGGKLATAGTLFGGRKFWAMATFNADSTISDKRDSMKLNLLLATAIDGTMATEGSWIAERVVCNNTLQIGRGEKTLRVKIRHNTKFDAKQVKADLGIETAQSIFAQTIADMRRMAAVRVSPIQVVTATAELLHPGFGELDSDKQAKVLRSKAVETIGKLALDGTAIGADMAGASGTAYGWLNAVTQFVDHIGKARQLADDSKTGNVDRRLDSAWFGAGSDLKDRAFAMAGDFDDRDNNAGAVASVDSWLAAHR